MLLPARLFSLVLLFAALPVQTLYGANHALLIGISDYPVSPLEGPVHDVMALKQTLVQQMGYDSKSIQILLNSEATRNGILSAIDGLYEKSRPGDKIFVYLSGHGTSKLDTDIRAPLPTTSGAFIPYDVANVESMKELMGKLIVGRDDLKPRFDRLDEGGRHLFIIMDACYSGNTVRGLRSFRSLPKRSLSLTKLLPSKGFGDDLEASSESWADQELTEREIYPYRNIFYLSAAGEHEVAQDIPSGKLDEYPTIDGKPHGAFTDTMLRIFQEPASADHDQDGLVSYSELMAELRTRMRHRGFSHTPQGLPTLANDKTGLNGEPVFLFRVAKAATSSNTQEPGGDPASVQGQTEGDFGSAPINPASTPAPALKEQVRPSLPRVKVFLEETLQPRYQIENEIVDGIEWVDNRSGADYALISNGEGLLQWVNDAGDILQTLNRASKASLVGQLRYFTYLNEFNAATGNALIPVHMELQGLGKGNTAVRGETIGFSLSLPKGGYLMIVNMDMDGKISVLYPYDKTESKVVPASSVLTLPDFARVTPPFGRDMVFALVFSEPSSLYYDLVGDAFDFDTHSARSLVGMLASIDASEKGVSVLPLITAEKPSR